MQKDPSQFVNQVQQQLYPIIERLNSEKQESISRTSVRARRNVNKAISYFENGLDLVEKAFFKGTSKKKSKSTDNGSRSTSWEGEQRQSYRRQPQEQMG